MILIFRMQFKGGSIGIRRKACSKNEQKNRWQFICGIYLAISHQIAHPRSGKSLNSISFLHIFRGVSLSFSFFSFCFDIAVHACRLSLRTYYDEKLLIEYRRNGGWRREKKYIIYSFWHSD